MWPFGPQKPGFLSVRVTFGEVPASFPLTGVRVVGLNFDRLLLVGSEEGGALELPAGDYLVSIDTSLAPKPVPAKVKGGRTTAVELSFRYPAILKSSVFGIAEIIERSDWDAISDSTRVRPAARMPMVLDRDLHKPELASTRTDDLGRFWLPASGGKYRLAVTPLSRGSPLIELQVALPTVGALEVPTLRVSRTLDPELPLQSGVFGEVRLRKFHSRESASYTPLRGAGWRLSLRADGQVADERILGSGGSFVVPLPPGEFLLELRDPKGKLHKQERVVVRGQEKRRVDYEIHLYRE